MVYSVKFSGVVKRRRTGPELDNEGPYAIFSTENR